MSTTPGLVLLEDDAFYLLLETGDGLFLDGYDIEYSTDADGNVIDDDLDAFITENGIGNLPISDGAVDVDQLAARAIVAGKIAARAITAETMDVDQLSAIAADMGTLTAGTVRDPASKILLELDQQRLRVTDGTYDRVLLGAIGGGDFGLRVANAGNIVIIDGSSDVFKIAASGTQSVTCSGTGQTTANTTLTGLGTFSACPVALMVHSDSNLATGTQQAGGAYFGGSSSTRYVAASSGGAVTTPTAIFDNLVRGLALLSSGHVMVRVTAWDPGATGNTIYQKYFVLVEAAF